MQVQQKHHLIAYSLLFAGLWAFFAFAMPNVLAFWEKNQLFRFTSEYWHFFDHEPFGRLIHLHTFLIQFSYYPLLGALVHASFFSLDAFLLNRCLGSKGNRVILPGFVFTALLLPSTANFGLLFPLTAVWVLGCARLWLLFENRFLRYACQLLILFFLTFLLREYVVWACLLYIALDFRQTRQAGRKFRWPFILPALCGTILGFGIGIFLSSPYDFIYFDDLFKFSCFAFSPSSSIPYAYFTPGPAVYVCLGCAAIVSLVSVFHIPSKVRRFAWIICLIAMVSCASIAKWQDEPVRSFQKVDKLCREYRWQDALNIIDSEWNKNKRWNNSNRRIRRLFCGQTKLALLASRKATSQLFTYPQPAFPLLFPMYMSNQPEVISLPTYYTFAGGFSESLHLSYDLVTSHDISANTLNDIIVNSLIVDDTTPAYKMTYLLEKSLFYRPLSAAYKDSSARNNLPVIQRGKKMLPARNYSVLGYRPDINAFVRHIRQPQNPYFYEYFLSVCLLNKQHHQIVAEIPEIRRFYHKGGIFLAPRHIQEAILASFDYTPSRYSYPQRIEGVGQEVWNDYWRFISDNQSYRNGNMTFSQLQKKWGHTYWFYDCYLQSAPIESASSQSVN